MRVTSTAWVAACCAPAKTQNVFDFRTVFLRVLLLLQQCIRSGDPYGVVSECVLSNLAIALVWRENKIKYLDGDQLEEEEEVNTRRLKLINENYTCERRGGDGK